MVSACSIISDFAFTNNRLNPKPTLIFLLKLSPIFMPVVFTLVFRRNENLESNLNSNFGLELKLVLNSFSKTLGCPLLNRQSAKKIKKVVNDLLLMIFNRGTVFFVIFIDEKSY